MSKKQHTSMKAIKNNWNNVFYAGYCDLSDIFAWYEPQYYNSGVYGWNCDIYCDYKRDIAISTGYRNITGKRIPTEIIKKYTVIAREIKSNTTLKYDDTMKELETNRNNFFDELLTI